MKHARARIAFALCASTLYLALPAQAAPDFSGIFEKNVALRANPKPPGGFTPGMEEVSPIPPLPGQKITNGAWEGDYTSSVLSPWAATIVKRNAEAMAAGHPIENNMTQCLPAGMPQQINRPGEVRIIQTPEKILFLAEHDFALRVIHMNARHPNNPKPTYMGDSIGHFEGDTLVVDTIGLTEKSGIDRYGTPHTKALHIIERFSLFNGGAALQDRVWVEDKGAFTRPWEGVTTWKRTDFPWIEFVCAQNNDPEP